MAVMTVLFRGKAGRRLVHLVGGCIPALLGLLLPRKPLLLFLGSVAALFVVGESLRLLVPAVNRWLMSFVSPAAGSFKDREAARPIGTTFFVLGSFLSFLIFPRDVAVAALFYSAVGDAAAATVGERFGHIRIGNKSLEGSAGFLASSLAVGVILVVAGLPLGWLTVAVGALVAALVELLPSPLVDDNLTIPLASGAAMALLR